MTRILVLLAGADFLLAILATLGAYGFLVSVGGKLTTFPTPDPAKLAIFGIVLVFSKFFVSLYRHHHKNLFAAQEAFLRILIAIFLSFLILSMLYTIAPDMSLLPAMFGSSLCVFGLVQLFLFYRYPLLCKVPGAFRNVLVLGCGPCAEMVASLIEEIDNFYNFSGYIEPNEGQVTFRKGTAVISQGELLDIVKENKIHKLVVAVADRRDSLPVRDLFSCKLRGVEVVDFVTFYEKLTGKLLLENIHPSCFIFDKGFRVTRLMFFKQRTADILASLAVIILTLPLFPIIALAIILDSKGPILYRQDRVGFKERTFQIVKFRTMYVNAEQDTGVVWARKNDQRVTRVGRFLRKSRLDELPQLFNVLKGDMSFVGPRPERPEFVETLKKQIPYYSRRHSVRPGLTGWAQVRYPYGASEHDAFEKLRYDLYYIKNFSLKLELQIILRTVRVVLFGKGGR